MHCNDQNKALRDYARFYNYFMFKRLWRNQIIFNLHSNLLRTLINFTYLMLLNYKWCNQFFLPDQKNRREQRVNRSKSSFMESSIHWIILYGLFITTSNKFRYCSSK